MVARVRRFNRSFTQRVGALESRFLGLDRPLGEARVLWEIGADGREVRDLRRRLDLDSGYLSRLLRSLEAAGLVAVGPGPTDRRVRAARLTAAGLTERAQLDRRSDDLASSLLEPLSPSQRQRLVGALDEVERLLDAGLVTIDVVDPGLPAAQHCLGAYYDELDRRFPSGFDAGRSRQTGVDDMRPPAGAFFLASLRGDPVGCGVLRFHPGEPTEIKRVWVAPSARGTGLGRRLMARLEQHARDQGSTVVRLDTNASLTEAIALYRSTGYREVPAFNDETYADHWFEKRLDGLSETPGGRAARGVSASGRS
jgi:DNA-binding MarR family transcriptional regulator/RimJ/RimL family protein N-acetyltransferase